LTVRIVAGFVVDFDGTRPNMERLRANLTTERIAAVSGLRELVVGRVATAFTSTAPSGRRS
jgi:hypothetical protein